MKVVTEELHTIRAHLLQYASLLEDFSQAITFITDTPNPIIHSTSTGEDTSSKDQILMEKECKNLMTQIKRLQLSREMWDKRLQNVMHLVRHGLIVLYLGEY